jgi:hypothetical protein
VFVGAFFGSMYFNLPGGYHNLGAYVNRLALFFFSVVFLIVDNMQCIPELHDERALYYRESSACCYSPCAYWIAHLAVKVPQCFVNVFFYCALLYYMAGLSRAEYSFAYFYYDLAISDVIGLLICQNIAFLSSSTQVAMGLLPITLFIATAFSGFIIYLPQFPAWLGDWGPYISFARYAFQGLVLNEFDGNADLPANQQYINILGFDTLDKSQCAAILPAFIVLHAGMAYAALHYVNFEKR